jgi:hypothetical protein
MVTLSANRLVCSAIEVMTHGRPTAPMQPTCASAAADQPCRLSFVALPDRSTFMRVMSCIAIATLAASHAAAAQPAPQTPPFMEVAPLPPVAPGDLYNYCVYENRTYSLGSGLCLGRTAYVCVPSPGPSTGNRAYWTSKDDPIFSRPACP